MFPDLYCQCRDGGDGCPCGLLMILAMQSKTNVRVGNFFLLRVKGSADSSCATMTLASLSGKH